MLTGIPGKTGVVYTLDRETGEFLWATPTITQNVISGIDGATGVVTENAELVFTAQGQTVLACPHASGGKDWEAGAYSPLTDAMPVRNSCARTLATTEGNMRGSALGMRHQLAPGTDQLGAVHAGLGRDRPNPLGLRLPHLRLRCTDPVGRSAGAPSCGSLRGRSPLFTFQSRPEGAADLGSTIFYCGSNSSGRSSSGTPQSPLPGCVPAIN